MATSLKLEKMDRPELAKHDSSILGKFFLLIKFLYFDECVYIFRSRLYYGLYGFDGILY